MFTLFLFGIAGIHATEVEVETKDNLEFGGLTY